jgi:hypothetical protein
MRSSRERIFVQSSLVVLKKWGEFSSQYIDDGEVGPCGRVLCHVERSTLLRKGATWMMSGESGVEGVVGDGEREVVAVCEDDEEGMIEEREGDRLRWEEKREGQLGR